MVLFNQEFRGWVEREQRKETEMGEKAGGAEGGIRPWNVGVVISGGNTTLEAIVSLFGPSQGERGGNGTTKGKGEVGNNDRKEKEEVGNGLERSGNGFERERERQEGKITMDRKKVVEDVAG